MHEVESMFYVQDVPWHKLGHRFTEPPARIDEALIAAGLDWNVERVPLARIEVGEGENPDRIDQPVDHFATIRTDTRETLGVVGPRYRPLQNRQAFRTFQPFLDAGEATLECAGSLRGGRRVWVLAKIQREADVIVGADRIASYVLLSHGHDGSLAIHYGLTPVRVVCANTEALARSAEGSSLLRIRHTEGAVRTLKSVSDVMNLASGKLDVTIEQYRFLASRSCNRRDLARFVKIVSGVPAALLDQPAEEVLSTRMRNKMQRVTRCITEGAGNQLPGARGTWWGAYNGVTDFYGRYAGRTPDSRLESMWFGTNANQNVIALQAATDFAQAA